MPRDVDTQQMIYAIFETNCFNQGKVTLKRLTDCFENMFDVDVGNAYHIYTELKERQNRTQFLDELKANLIVKMDADDSR